MLGREGRRREEEVIGGAADVGAGLVRSKRGRKKGMRAGGSLTRGEKGGSRRGIRSQLFAATLVNGACDWPNPVRKRLLLLQWPHC